MGTTTPRIGLYKPASDGDEFVDVLTNLNNNWDKVEEALGFIPVTVFPVAPFDGMMVNKSGDGIYTYSLGTTTWVQLLSPSEFKSNVLLQAAKRLGIGTTSPTAPIDIRNAVAGTVLTGRVTGDTQPRINIDTNRISFGSGSVAPEVSITRSATDQLTVDGALIVDTTFNAGGDVTMGGNLNLTGNLAVNGGISGNLSVGGNLSVTGTGQILSAVKTASQIVNNSVTLVNDTVLFMNVVANATYILLGTVSYASPTAADIKFNWTFPVGATISYTGIAPGTAATAADGPVVMTSSSAAQFIRGGTATSIGMQIQGMLTTGANAGTLRLQFAQNTATVGDTTVFAGSNLMLIRVA